MLGRAALTALTALAFLAPLPAAADCPVHIVRKGETLRIIAERYLGSRDRSGAVYARNKRRIGANPNLITSGLQLSIPCTPKPTQQQAAQAGDRIQRPDNLQDTAVAQDQAMAREERAPTPASTPAPVVVHPQEPVGSTAGLRWSTQDPPLAGENRATPSALRPPAAPAQEQTPADVIDTSLDTSSAPVAEIFVLTGAPMHPFVDPAHPGGGMVPELVLAAFAETSGPPVRIGFVNDRAAHLDIVMPRGGFAFSVPWLLPDCAAPDLSPPQTALCERYYLSDSLYEHVTEYFTRAAGSFENARALSDLAGARLCRPAGFPLDDLTMAGLLPDAITLFTPATSEECLRALDAGQIDIASLDGALARAVVAGATPDHPILVLEQLSRVERLHAVALAEDAAGRAAVDRLNAGLAILVETGLWYRIVQRHFGLAG